MKRISIFAAICLSTLLSWNCHAETAGASPVYFAPLPMSNAKLNLVKSQLIIQTIEKALDRPAIPKLYDTYQAIIDAFLAGEVDFVELGPLTYLALSERTEQVSPLVSVNQTTEQKQYQCVVAAPIDGIDRLSQLSKKPDSKVALTRPLSTCGWLLTEHLLKQNDIQLSELPTKFLGTHQEVALALVRKEYAIGGLASFVAERYAPLGLKILETSDPLPQFIIAGNPKTVSREELQKVQETLLNTQPKQGWGIGSQGFSCFSEDLFEGLKAIQSKGTRDLMPLENQQ
ncbi:MAG: PhnD/SsuA/transferrin family substrate-binding protein [Thiomicrorhabdus chilensis]|uniref:PhnD/SsuA/transferrin family substrate-binding protein n=1 Tax=Thiomicrorhabdus chilensis TaxID=63656 RepID=UPI00299E634E|nr:PhnD/SsuA/transferrin family substrate-binding protein [Thiomicrorhabdus chilensis]MDX1346662.1 PhnD/SsuA/transferrin family substrate-binding protein [Thiomicrorhabdus chilensis]